MSTMQAVDIVAVRTNCLSRLGYDPTIPDDLCEQISEIVSRGWVIVGREYNGFRLTLQVNPKYTMTLKGLLDLEMQLLKLDMPSGPNHLATEFTGYSMSFISV